MKKITVPIISSMKDKEKIVMITAYDAPTARIVDEAGVDIVLVGDSVGNVIQGLSNTLPVTVDEMIYHTRIVSRGIQNAHLCADMPFMSFQSSKEDAVKNAGRFVKEAGAESVKLEVTNDYIDTIREIRKAGIPVMGHIGLRPQSFHDMGGYKLQGRGKGEGAELLALAKKIEDAGAFSLVLESIPQKLAKKITRSIKIPTIGIGAGPDCDGQVLVINDLVGLSEEPLPKFVKKYAEVRETMKEATKDYVDEVKKGVFPSSEHSYD
ncbi:MAG: 3-methyl-2-oxobutanoate hydroxymethyltransferase [Thermodesulfobacteriales bacterium]|jgi:3-methyl-2-oxobutanoate hydroxymethyltransferase|nr:MAG: 3-methyl-2-oxobutanoate hydroxymethyltransferase [Thermodesulfobacteriales bacterium]